MRQCVERGLRGQKHCLASARRNATRVSARVLWALALVPVFDEVLERLIHQGLTSYDCQ
jgi:hypothetical protein